MKILCILSIVLFFSISCNSGGGGGGEKKVSPEADAPADPGADAPADPEADAPADPGADAPADPEADAPADDEIGAPQNFNSQEFIINLNQRKMNLFVVENDNEGNVVRESPLLYSYQDFNLSSDSLKIKAICNECINYAFISHLSDGTREHYQSISENFVIKDNLDDNSHINGLIISPGETKFVTVQGYKDDGSVVATNYLKVTNHNNEEQSINPISGPVCSEKMFQEHKARQRSTSSFNSECFNDGVYNATGIIEKDKGVYHLVYLYFDSETNKESIKYDKIDLVNYDISVENANQLFQKISSNTQFPLKRFSFLVEENLTLGNRDYVEYPEPQITRDLEGNLVISAVKGANKLLTFYKFDSFSGSWLEIALPQEITGVKKIKFSKRKNGDGIVDVLYYLKDDGSLHEFSLMGGMPMVDQVYSFSNAFVIDDFSVDFNPVSEITKFAFTSNEEKFFLAKYQENFTLNSFELTSCKNGESDVVFADVNSGTKFFTPAIKVSDDGRAWFKFNSSKPAFRLISSEQTKTFLCKEDILNSEEVLQANGFNNSFTYLLDVQNGSGNLFYSSGVDGDIVLSSVINEETSDYDFYFLGHLITNSALFGKMSRLYRIFSSFAFPFITQTETFNGVIKNRDGLGYEDVMDYAGDIHLSSVGNYDVVALGNYYNLKPDDASKISKNYTCLSVSNSNHNDFNSYQDFSLGISDNGNDAYQVLDADNDGLEDYFEVYLGLDPSSPDSDSDGVSDYDQALAACKGE